jgi:hypothetical protein
MQLMIPESKKPTAMQHWKKTCHKVGLPIEAIIKNVESLPSEFK